MTSSTPTTETSENDLTAEEQAAVALLEAKAEREREEELKLRAERRRADAAEKAERARLGTLARRTRFTAPAVRIIIEQRASEARQSVERLRVAWEEDTAPDDLRQTAAQLVSSAMAIQDYANRYLARASRAPVELPMSVAMGACRYAEKEDDPRAAAMAEAMVREVKR